MKKTFLLSLLLVFLAGANVWAEDVELVLKPSKDLALRQGNSNQSGTGSTIEIRENSNNAEALGYHFCGIMAFDIQDISNKVAEGYTVKEAKLFLTDCSNNQSSLLQIKPFPYGWEEDKSTTYDNQVDYVNEAIAADALATLQLKRYGGKKSFELQNASNHVYPFPLDAYQSYSENNDGLIAYITAAAKNNDSEMGILIGRDTYSSQNCGIYTKDVDKINIASQTKNCSQYSWNAETNKWEKVEGSDNSISRIEATLQFFCMTQAEFADAVCPRLYVTLTKGGDDPQPEPAYYVVGNMNEWKVSDEYKMTLNEAAEGTTEYMFTMNLTTTSQFKVAKSFDGTTINDDDWYPAGMGNAYGENGEITADGEYTIYFRPNADGGDDWFNKVIYAAAVVKHVNQMPTDADHPFLMQDIEVVGAGKIGDTFDSFRNNGAAVMKMNCVQAGVYLIDFDAVSKNGATIRISVADAEGTVEGKTDVEIEAAGNWTDWLGYQGKLGYITEGAKTVTITFISSANNWTSNMKNLSFTIDPETTGISTIDNSKLTVGSYFDLQGRRVSQPTKGLYIVNGRKVVIK